MKYIFELNHPKHYYQFKYIMQSLQKQGHEILVLARDKDVLLKVLEEENVPYTIFGNHHKSMTTKILGTFAIIKNYLAIARRFRPDFYVSKGSWYGTFTAKLMRRKSIIFIDSEVIPLNNLFVVPICTKVITAQSFKLDYGSKHIRVPGLFEDCYLSPSVFQADPSVIQRYNLTQPYAILRFVGWEANHDVGRSGFTLQQKEELVRTVSKYMTVYISSEKPLPENLAKYQLPTPAALIHHVLSAASLYVGDSQTMATEAALVGTPAIRSNSFVGPKDMSNFIMLQETYGMLFNIADPDDAIKKAEELASHDHKTEWQQKREKYYAHTGDINATITNLLTNL